MTRRLVARINRDFGASASNVMNQLRAAEVGSQNSERVLAAIILVAEGNHDRLHNAVELSRIDWRDVLVGGGLANEDWPEQLDRALGPV